jgi:hypothetical protein
MNGKRDVLIIPVAAVVLLAWIVSLMSSILTDSFVSLTITTPVMIMLAGYVFGVSITKSKQNDDS